MKKITTNIKDAQQSNSIVKFLKFNKQLLDKESQRIMGCCDPLQFFGFFYFVNVLKVV